jgi:hypothetical protein
MDASTAVPALRRALLASAMIVGLGACTAGREDNDDAQRPVVVEAPPPASSTGNAGGVDGATSTDRPALSGDVAEAACNADALQALVGQQASETIVAQATADSGATSVRVLGPDDVATMDFRSDRLTIHTSGDGNIERLNCG